MKNAMLNQTAKTFHNLLFTVLCLLVVLRCTSQARADYVVTGQSTYRITDSGEFVGNYYFSIDQPSPIESLGEDHVVTPDLGTVYEFTNTLGISYLTLAFDVDTLQYLPDKTLK